MAERNLKQVDILRAAEKYETEIGVKIKKSDLSQYVNDKVEPRHDKLAILAKILNVSEAWLMGFDVNRNRVADQEGIEDDLLAKEIQETVLKLNKQNRENVYHYAKQKHKEQNRPYLIELSQDNGDLSEDSTMVVAAHIEGEVTDEMREFINQAKKDVKNGKFKK